MCGSNIISKSFCDINHNPWDYVILRSKDRNPRQYGLYHKAHTITKVLKFLPYLKELLESFFLQMLCCYSVIVIVTIYSIGQCMNHTIGISLILIAHNKDSMYACTFASICLIPPYVISKEEDYTISALVNLVFRQ